MKGTTLVVFFGVILVSILVAFFVAQTYIPKASAGWDEATHIHWAYRIYESLQARNFFSFLRITFSQTYYPPLQSWLYGIPLLLFDFSIEKIRILGLFWFVLGSFLIFVLGDKLGGKQGKLTGGLSLFFFLSSPMMLLFSSLVLKEMIGAAFSLLVALVYFWARSKKTPLPYILVALTLFILAMTKYNYGFLMAIVIFLEAAVSFLLSKKRQVIFLSHLFIFLPFLLLLGIWLFFPYNKLLPYISVVISPSGFQTRGMTDFWGILLFYPRAIILMYSPSIILGIFLLLSFALSLKYFKDFRIRVLWLLVAVNLLPGIIYNGNMQQRYIFTSMPFLFLMGAFILANLLTKSFTFAKRPFFFSVILAVWLLTGGKIFVDMVHLPKFVYAVGAYALRYPVFNQIDYQDKNVWFNYDISSWPQNLPTGSFEKPGDVLDFIASSVDLTKPVKLVGYTNEVSPDYFELVAAAHREKKDFLSLSYSSFVATLEIFPTSRFYTRDYQLMNSWQIDKIREIENDPSLILIKKRKFEELDMEIAIYGQR